MTTPTEAPREALPVVAWLYYEGEADALPEPGQDVWRSILLSLSRHEAYRNETPLVRLIDAQSALESERQAHAAEVERLRGDAERYQWLRRYPNNLDGRVYGPTYSRKDGGLLRRDDYLDAAIDQAIARGMK